MTTAMEEWTKLTSKSIARNLASNIIHNERTGKKPVQMTNFNLEAELWLATGDVPPCLDTMRKLYPPNGNMYDPVPAVPNHKEIQNGITTYAMRREARLKFIKEFGFPIPCKELIKAIKSEGPIVELGAGSGYLAALINQCGGDVVATDSYKGGFFFKVSSYGNVQRLRATTAVKKFPDRTVLMSWPPYMSRWPSYVANRMKAGNRLIYIGEACGCTASYGFERILSKDFKEIKEVSIPQWEGLHDSLRIFEKE